LFAGLVAFSAKEVRSGSVAFAIFGRPGTGARWPPSLGSSFEPSFEQGATHSAKTEIVRIILTALRADHEWFSGGPLLTV
jgi:hypothetical protein